MSSRSELSNEIRSLLSGNVSIADGIFPPLVFVAVNAIWGVTPAAVAGVATALLISSWRLARRQPLRFALAGLAGTVIAALVAVRSGSATGYFLPGLISGALTTLLILASIAVRKPFVAWTSWITRGWPIEWYWHPQVRPAYMRTTWIWAAFFGLRTTGQGVLFLSDQTTALGLVRVATGWPGLAALLILTYTLGRKWLEGLKGPSVEEFKAHTPPPWSGQQQGF
jgi:hypothetical protein